MSYSNKSQKQLNSSPVPFTPFWTAPPQIWRLGLTAHELVVFLNLLHRYPNIYPTRETIARETGLSLATVKRTLVSLRDRKLITWKTGGRKTANTYIINIRFFSNTHNTTQSKTESTKNASTNTHSSKSIENKPELKVEDTLNVAIPPTPSPDEVEIERLFAEKKASIMAVKDPQTLNAREFLLHMFNSDEINLEIKQQVAYDYFAAKQTLTNEKGNE